MNKKILILFLAADFVVFVAVAAMVMFKTKQPGHLPPTENAQTQTPSQIVKPSETKKEALIYFYDKSMSHLAAHKITLPHAKQAEGKESARFCANRLLEGPPKKSTLVSTFPEDVAIKNISVENGTATVDFNKNFLKPYGATQEIGMVGSLVLTLTAIPGIKNVQILCEGKKVPYLPEGTEIGNLLTRSDFEVHAKKN